ncbi:hypothetical protein [Massilia sp. LXY-6]|uniref:hypothetical protein n=1 Tax=Massilia sp. LXY-6 TaxID=3379823 RepID=UPI003F49BDCA
MHILNALSRHEDAMNRTITPFHAPQSRSGAVRILLEELGAPHTLEVLIWNLALKREPAPPSMCPYGDYDTMLATLTRQLRGGAGCGSGRGPVGMSNNGGPCLRPPDPIDVQTAEETIYAAPPRGP